MIRVGARRFDAINYHGIETETNNNGKNIDQIFDVVLNNYRQPR